MDPSITTGAPKPELNIPQSVQTVDVRVIDSTARIKIPVAAFIQDKIPGHDFLECPAYSFLVEHCSGQKVLFDLGVRKDIDGFSPVILDRIKQIVSLNGAINVESDIATILRQGEDSIELEKINAIIWSHWHMDHSGDPSTFPGSTALVVGPGFKEALLPGYPSDPMGRIRETDYEERELQEIDFDSNANSLNIGKFRAIDYFGDGSFYLLDSPGHTVGHMCALARTTPSTFIFMGGDACHHCGSLRPTEYIPLPAELSPSPLSVPPHAPGTVCPGSLLETVHPHKSKTIPFYKNLSAAADRNIPAAEETISKLTDFDANDNVFVMIAHDTSLLGVVDFYPKKANHWQEKGWKKVGQWRFLEDFQNARRPRV